MNSGLILVYFCRYFNTMRKLSLALILIIGWQFLNAQEQTWRCATPEMNRIELEKNPQARADREALQRFVDDFIRQNPKDDQVYVIPVVFHVVHYYGPENISKEQIEDQIRILNNDFRKLNSDTVNIIAPFKNLATDSHIEFRLAKLDPNGNCTDGITRTVSYETYNGSEEIKEIAPSWPRSKYLNVWVVNRIPGGVAGYAYYPGTAPDGRDGILIDHAYIGSIGAGDIGRSRTLTHEIGHYLNLAHPWGSTNEPGLPENCDIDDGIEDTPNTIGHTTCNLWAVTCGSLDNVQNYMEYSYCGNMFTHGQGAVMRATLNSSVSQRNNLWSEANLIATGVFDPEAIAICDPIADWGQSQKIVCTDTEIQYYDLTYNTDSIADWQWQFEGGIPEVSEEQSVTVVYENPGKFDTQLTVSNPTGTDTKLRENTTAVYSHEDAFDLPYSYGFEDAAFPAVSGSDFNDFTIVSQGSAFWTRNSSGAATGSWSIRIKNLNNEENISNSFYTPLLAIDTNSFPITVNFKTAYAKASNTTNDIFRVYYSLDCGKSWVIRFYKSGNSLKTTDDYYPSGTFIPNQNQWRTDSFQINRPANFTCGSVRIRFETLNKGGNCLYVDDIEVNATSSASNPDVLRNNNLQVFPNPFGDELFITGTGSENYSVTVCDITGRKIACREYYSSGVNIAGLFEGTLAGTYILHIETTDGVYIRRINRR